MALERGTLRVGASARLRDAAEKLIQGMKSGAARNRSGEPYKPSVIRSYETSLSKHVLPDLGSHRLGDLRLADLQALVDRLMADGLDASTIRNVIVPVRVIYRRALNRGEVAVNPTQGLELPAVRGKRDRIVPVDEAMRLLKAAPAGDRGIWATAMLAGLRRAELMALDCESLDFDLNSIFVVRSWDVKEGSIEPKSAAGRRTVPIGRTLRGFLREHLLRTGRRQGLFFGRTRDLAFTPTAVAKRARRAWKKAKLEPITLHDCRHTFASFMIAAGANAKALQTIMGHASITVTLDRYGHLMPGAEAEAGALLDTYVEAELRAANDG